MAFPTSPIDKQVYKGYRYNTAKGAWERITPLNTDKVSIKEKFEIVYNDATESLDFDYVGE